MTQLVISRAQRIGKALVASSTRVLIIGLLLLIVVGWRLEPNLFLTKSNLYVISSAASVPLLITIAASVALLAGVIDLSVGSMTGFGAAVFAICIGHGLVPFAAAAVALICALAVGAFNATACVFFGANPLIVTLGTLTALQGLTLILLNNISLAAFLPGLYNFTNATWAGIPVLLLIALVFGGAASILLAVTRWGRHIRAAGGDPAVSNRAGIPVGKLKFCLFILTAVIACIGGILYVGQDGAAQTTLGFGLELQIYAPILLAGYSLTRGGVGNVMGAVAGVAVLEVVDNLLNLRSVNPYWQYIITGAIILVAVYADVLRGGERFE